jgi:hypothetical protein
MSIKYTTKKVSNFSDFICNQVKAIQCFKLGLTRAAWTSASSVFDELIRSVKVA